VITDINDVRMNENYKPLAIGIREFIYERGKGLNEEKRFLHL